MKHTSRLVTSLFALRFSSILTKWLWPARLANMRGVMACKHEGCHALKSQKSHKWSVAGQDRKAGIQMLICFTSEAACCQNQPVPAVPHWLTASLQSTTSSHLLQTSVPDWYPPLCPHCSLVHDAVSAALQPPSYCVSKPSSKDMFPAAGLDE